MSPEPPIDGPRYALYWAPPPDGPLERFGTTWLGRHHRTGEVLAQPDVPGVTPERLAALTAAARRYGLHGTLKAPFRLAAGLTARGLHDAVRGFAARQPAFLAPALEVADLDGFIALVPSAPAPALDRLAERCVRELDRFRAAPGPAELARRQRAGLTARQVEHLRRFGYPHVLADFRFHVTLTERLAAAERRHLLDVLRELCAELCAAPLPVDAIAVYEQADAASPFMLTSWHALQG